MKLNRSAPASRGFTLPELLTATALTALITTSLLAVNIFGLRMATSSGTRLQASDDMRTTITRVMQDIKGAYSLQIGEGNEDTFTRVADNRNQVGNALQIYPTTNTANFIRYYYVHNSLRRTDGHGVEQVSTRSVTNFTGNLPIFTEEDLSGQPLVSTTTLAPIHIRLSFIITNRMQLMSGNYNFYQLETCATPRQF